ncbi:MAG TPA: DedA family protein [Aggregatilinea sp.]|jgi:membrane-associated protein|uniref:DedA family protein n=1 Tax=Aggregatilinea sp. TaxID=2806333 RepID=UPI002BA21C09|nr:DedA family protein [Aggregatilinea sp.]HML21179.1 DedA family protein [Aggregatilinea sp.]
MDAIKWLIDFVLHIDTHLTELVTDYGMLTYGVLFAVIFAETGFVVTPFLPGDSLLFAAGAIAALGSLNIWLIVGVLAIAAIVGDTANYWIGHFFGHKLVDNPRIRFINQDHIDKTEKFYAKHGGKTIILARFVPIVRTFAPFVAGVGTMHYEKFLLYNVIGGSLWVAIFTLGGYFFGNMSIIKNNFHYTIFVIIGLSLVPLAYEYIQNKRHSKVQGVDQAVLENVVNE